MHNMPHYEEQYLSLMRCIWTEGAVQRDRTGVGTKALFGATMRFSLADDAIPLLTTKRVYWKTAAREMLWFLTGDTNIQPLLQQNVKIWTDWPLARYRRETGEEITQEAFEQRIVEDDAFAIALFDHRKEVHGTDGLVCLVVELRAHRRVGRRCQGIAETAKRFEHARFIVDSRRPKLSF
jgi:thymidylate synthase